MVMESLNIAVEDIKHKKEFSKKTSTEHTNNTCDTKVQHNDKYKPSVDSNTGEEDDKNIVDMAIKPRKTESGVKKYHLADAVIRDTTKEEGQEERSMLTTGKWQD